MATFQVFKETALPSAGARQPHSVYFIAPPGAPDFFEIYATGASATTIKRVIDAQFVQDLIEANLAGISGIEVVDTIAQRDALTPTSNVLVWVLDATADPTVNSGAASYVYRLSTTTWHKLSEAESQDIVLAWANITGGPLSSPAAIDSAVAASHTHANISQLNKIGENGSGQLTYDGNLPVTAWASEGW